MTQNKSNPITISALSDMFWSSTNSGVRFGLKSAGAFGYDRIEEGAYVDGGIYTIFDTAAESIFLSSLWYESFIE